MYVYMYVCVYVCVYACMYVCVLYHRQYNTRKEEVKSRHFLEFGSDTNERVVFIELERSLYAYMYVCVCVCLCMCVCVCMWCVFHNITNENIERERERDNE